VSHALERAARVATEIGKDPTAWRNASREIAQAAVERLLLDGIPVMGVIFNCWDPSNSDTYAYARCRQDFV
jgi:hypothetical protein